MMLELKLLLHHIKPLYKLTNDYYCYQVKPTYKLTTTKLTQRLVSGDVGTARVKIALHSRLQ